jgi:hypothetical protein
MDKQLDKQLDGQFSIQMNSWKDIKIRRLTCRQMNNLKDRQIKMDRITDRQIGSQVD